MKAYLYYFLKKGFTQDDVKKAQKAMPHFDIERTSNDELLVKAETKFEKLYGQAFEITKSVKSQLGQEVQHNRTITFRDL